MDPLTHFILIEFHTHMPGALYAVIFHRYVILDEDIIEIIAGGDIYERICCPVCHEEGHCILIYIILRGGFGRPFRFLTRMKTEILDQA